MKRIRLIEQLRQRLRHWLIPRSNESIIGLTVELDGADKLIQDLDQIEQRLDVIITKAEVAAIALQSVSKQS